MIPANCLSLSMLAFYILLCTVCFWGVFAPILCGTSHPLKTLAWICCLGPTFVPQYFLLVWVSPATGRISQWQLLQLSLDDTGPYFAIIFRLIVFQYMCMICFRHSLSSSSFCAFLLNVSNFVQSNGFHTNSYPTRFLSGWCIAFQC